MSTIKNVLSHSSKNPTTGEGSHLEQTHQSQNTSTPANPFTSPTTQSSSSSIHPDRMLGKTHNPTDGASTASIKSGVMGFPQTGDQHAALKHHDLDRDSDYPSVLGSGLPDRTAVGQNPEHSQYGRDSAIGAGTTEAGILPARALHHSRDHDNLRASEQFPTETGASTIEKPYGTGHSQPFQQSANDPIVTTDTDRSFPLAGGVTSRQHNPQSSTVHDSLTSGSTTNERHSNSNNHGREALAGAAAAAATVSAGSSLSKSDRERHADGETLGGTRGAPSTSSGVLRSEHELRSGHQHDQSQGLNREALAGATAAAAASSSAQTSHQNSRSADHFDPCASESVPPSTMFTAGPHKTDTANRIDPHLHMPGEFPETPLETPGARSNATGYQFGSNKQPEISPLESVTTAPLTTNDTSRSDTHHHTTVGLGAAGLGAAGVGAYEAGKHHQHEPTNIDHMSSQKVAASTNPYSLNKIDPRVDSRPATFEKQRFDPVAPTNTPSLVSDRGIISSNQTTQQPFQAQNISQQENHHHGRDAGLVGAGAATAGGLYYASQHGDKSHRESQREILPTSQTTQQSLQGHSERGIPTSQTGTTHQTLPGQTEHQVKDHHHGRDAGIVGAGAATAGGLHHLGHHGDNSPRDTQREIIPTTQRDTTHQTIQDQQEGKDHHYGRDAGIAGAGAATVGGLHFVGQRTGNSPRQSESEILPTSQKDTTHQTLQGQAGLQQKDNNHGRNAGIAGVGAAAAAGGLHHAGQRDGKLDSGPASATIGPHKSNVANILDPRVQPDPALQKHHQVGNTVGSGHGAQKAAETYGEHRSTHPSSSMEDQRYDTTAPGAHDPSQAGEHHHGRDAALGAGAGALASGVSKDHDHSQHSSSEHHHPVSQTADLPPSQKYMGLEGEYDPYEEHHYSRDAGLGAAGAGVAATGIHTGSNKHDGDVSQTQSSRNAGLGAAGAGVAATGIHAASNRHDGDVSQAHSIQDLQQPALRQHYDSEEQRRAQDQQHHGKHQAVAAGGVGGVAGAGAGYAYSQHEAKEAEKQRLAQQKAYENYTEHQHKVEQKSFEKQQKSHEKEFEHEQKEIAKHQAKELKHQDKIVAAEYQTHSTGNTVAQHPVPIQEKRLSNDAVREIEKGDGKEKKHLLGFLHKTKSTSPESSPRSSREHTRPIVTEDAHDGRHKLHKDPPKGHPAWEVLEARKHEQSSVGPTGYSEQIPEEHGNGGYGYGIGADAYTEGEANPHPQAGLPADRTHYRN